MLTLKGVPENYWSQLKNEVAGIVTDGMACGPVSYRVGFCAAGPEPKPSPEEARMGTGCRGQPGRYLESLETTEQSREVQRKTVWALLEFFEKQEKEIALESRSSLAEKIHAARILDQAIIRLKLPEKLVREDRVAAYGIRWMFECAHRRYAASLVRRLIANMSPEDLADMPQLAEDVWLLTQHATMYPKLQKRVLEYFKSYKGKSFNRFIAYLTDRYRRNLGLTQQYATQLGCGDGKLHVAPMDARDEVDRRRRRLGMTPLDDYLADWEERCRVRSENE